MLLAQLQMIVSVLVTASIALCIVTAVAVAVTGTSETVGSAGWRLTNYCSSDCCAAVVVVLHHVIPLHTLCRL
jgi:hypothetical protein